MHIKDLGVLFGVIVALACAGGERGEVGDAESAAMPGASATERADRASALQPGAPSVGDSVGMEPEDSADAAMGGRVAGSEPEEDSQAGADPDTDESVASEPVQAGPDESGDVGQSDPAAILRAASARYASITSLQAEFEMVTENRLLRSRTPSAGTLYQRRPDRIKLDFSAPAGDVVVSDGEWIWAYYPSADAAQAMRVPAGQGAGGAVDLQAQFVGDPVARFVWEDGGREDVGGRPARVLTLTPREELSYARLKVWIDAEDSLVRRFEVTEHNGTVRHMELRQIRLNPTLNDALFRFTPPPGVRVVEGG